MKANNTTPITHSTILVDTSSVHLENSILDSKGNNFAFTIRRDVIKKYGYMIPTIVDSNLNVLCGTRDVEIALELGIKKIPVIIVNEKLSSDELRKIEIELHQSDRNITHLEYSSLSFEHYLLSKNDEGTYSNNESERLGVTARSIQTKVALGKKWSVLNADLKSIIKEIDLRTKVDLKSLTAIGEATEDEIKKIISQIQEIGAHNMTNKGLKPLVSPIITRVKLDIRNRKLNKNLKNHEEKQEDIFKEEDFEKIDDILQNYEESISVKKMKKLFQYEIKIHFHIDIDKDEKSEIHSIKSEYSIDFNEEIELIKSLMKKD